MGDERKSSTGANSDADRETLPALVGRLGESIIKLLDTKLALLKVEIKEDLNAYLRDSLALGIGAFVILTGFALLNIAIAFLVSALFETTQLSQPIKYALGFILTGGMYLVIGVVVLLRAKKRLAKQDLIPEESLEELEKDKQWVRKGLSD